MIMSEINWYLLKFNLCFLCFLLRIEKFGHYIRNCKLPKL